MHCRRGKRNRITCTHGAVLACTESGTGLEQAVLVQTPQQSMQGDEESPCQLAQLSHKVSVAHCLGEGAEPCLPSFKSQTPLTVLH